MSEPYSAPLDALLSLGDNGIYDNTWYDYKTQLSLTAEHIPELIRMMTDQDLWKTESDLESWAPVHAWRALVQLQALEVLDSLFSLLDEDEMVDWFIDDAPIGLARMGVEVLPILETKLTDRQTATWGRVAVNQAMGLMAEQEPSLRDRIITNFIALLEDESETNEVVISTIIIDLLRLEAVDAAPAIEAAFKSGRVDEMLVGTWPHVQVELGLKQSSDFTERELVPEAMWALGQDLLKLEAQSARNQPLLLATPDEGKENRFGQLNLGLSGVPMKPKQGFKGGGTKAKGQKKKKKKR